MKNCAECYRTGFEEYSNTKEEVDFVTINRYNIVHTDLICLINCQCILTQQNIR